MEFNDFLDIGFSSYKNVSVGLGTKTSLYPTQYSFFKRVNKASLEVGKVTHAYINTYVSGSLPKGCQLP